MKAIFLFLISTFSISFALAQTGSYISPWGMGQKVNINNISDHWNPEVRFRPTYTYSFGIDFYENASLNYGWQTGISFTRMGQKYRGHIQNYNGDSDLNYTSSITLDYLQLPLAIRFNSNFNQKENFNVSIFAGFNISYLVSTYAETDPAPGEDLNSYDITNMFNRTPLGISLGAQMNILLGNNISLHSGIRMNSTLSHIEKSNYPFPANIPFELYYPISTKKKEIPPYALSPDDNVKREHSKSIASGIFIALSYKLGGD